MFDEFLNSLNWPFRDKNVSERLIPVLVAALIPVIGIFVLIGWQYSVVRQFARGDSVLPRLKPLVLLRDGFVISLLAFMLTFIPPLILSVLGVAGIGGLIDDLLVYSSLSFELIAIDWLQDAAIKIAVAIAWALLASPLVYAGIIRSAANDSLLQFLNVPASLLYIAKNMGGFIKFWFFGVIFFALVGVMSVLLGFTGIGLMFAPFLALWGYIIMTSYELGMMARRTYFVA